MLGTNGIRGVVGFSTAAYSSTPEFANAGSTFTDFAFIKDVGTSTTWVVAGVVSDSGFAELDSLLRFRASDRHTTSARLSLGILPYVSDPLSPVPDQNVRRLNMYNLDLQDDLKVSEMLSVIYGAELQVTDPSSKALAIPPAGGGCASSPRQAAGTVSFAQSRFPKCNELWSWVKATAGACVSLSA